LLGRERTCYVFNMKSLLSWIGVAGGATACILAAPGLGCGASVEPTGEGGGAASTSHVSSTSGTGGAGGTGGTGGCKSYAGACTPGQTMGVPWCTPEPSSSGGIASCQIGPGCVAAWSETCEPTPLVLSFDGAPIVYRTDHQRAFDLDGAQSLATDWPTAATPWLALDRDGSGSIEDGSELFGSMTTLPGGRRAANGFEALRELDTNADGRITAEDAAFARLLVWSDRDGDRRSSPGELVTAAAWGLLSIDLAYSVEPSCDTRGNCEVERATFRFVDGHGIERVGAVVDVHLAAR
jgi:hypothetical protein